MRGEFEDLEVCVCVWCLFVDGDLFYDLIKFYFFIRGYCCCYKLSTRTFVKKCCFFMQIQYTTCSFIYHYAHSTTL